MKTKKPLYIFLHLPKTGGTSFVRSLKEKLGEKKIIKAKNIDEISEKDKQNTFFVSGHEAYFGIHKHFPDREPKYIVFLRDPAERRVSQYNHDVSRMDSSKKPSFEKWYNLQLKDEQVFLLNKKFEGIPGRKAPASSNGMIKKLKIGSSKFLKMVGFGFLKLIYSNRNKTKEFENAKKLIKNCWVISTTNNLNEDIPKIFKRMGLDTKWKKYRMSKSQEAKSSRGKPNIEKFFEIDEETRNKIYKDNSYDLKIYEHAKSIGEIQNS